MPRRLTSRRQAWPRYMLRRQLGSEGPSEMEQDVVRDESITNNNNPHGSADEVYSSNLQPMDLDSYEEDNIPVSEEELGTMLEALMSTALNDDRIDIVSAHREMSIDRDVEEILNAYSYDDAVHETGDPTADAEPEELFNPDDLRFADITDNLLVDESDEDPEDLSHSVPFARSSRPLSKFRLALGIWCREAGISRPLYRSLLEILKMAELHYQVHEVGLPLDVAELKKEAAAHLPLLRMRKRNISLNPEQQSTRKSSEDLYFFDSKDLFKHILSSSLAGSMHFGLGHFVDSPEELWHANSWTSSIRTTSGEFARYPDGKPIFPSDFVEFVCGAITCTCADTPHLGRVFRVAKDYRATASVQGQIMAETQLVMRGTDLVNLGISTLLPDSEQLLPQEAFLSWNRLHFLSIDRIKRRASQVVLDYKYGDVSPEQPQTDPPISPLVGILIRRVLDDTESAHPIVFPLSLTHPPRGELEIAAFGRTHLEQFDSTLTGRRTLSLPLLTFIDGFGLYRNIYRSLMGMYVIPAALSFPQRHLRSNVFPLTLGPHGSNFNDVVMSMRQLVTMDKGCLLRLPVESGHEDVFVCGFTLAYLGDMPQQNENSGIKCQSAKYGCRCCYVLGDERVDMTYDVITHWRYHHQLVNLRKDLNTQPTKAAKNRFATDHGLSLEEPALATVSPALDLVLSRPADPAHSEYQGLSKLIHDLLLTEILTVAGAKIYAAALRTFPYPPGCAPPQGPLTHLKSYTLAEHGRWSYVIPVLLRTTLRLEHLQPFIRNVLLTDLPESRFNLDPISIIVDAFASLARSNSVLMGPVRPQARGRFQEFVVGFREKLQSLLRYAHDASSANPARSQSRSRQSSVSHNQTQAPGTLHESLAHTPARTFVRRDRAAQLMKDLRRPNIHVGLHHEQTLKEYGMPINVNTLLGENKHRLFKQRIYHTNHLNACRDLLLAENFRQTLRLGIGGAFAFEEPELTTVLQELHRDVPTLFNSILHRGEVSHMNQDHDADVEEVSAKIQSDPEHQNTLAIGKIKGSIARSVHDLPIKASQLTPSWLRALSMAYARDYNMPNIVHFPGSTIEWIKKFACDNKRTESRTSFRRNQFVYVMHPQSNDVRLVRIDQILVHKFANIRRLFIVGTVADTETLYDPVLGEGFRRIQVAHESNAQPFIVGLPAIQTDSLFVVPVSEDDSVGGTTWSTLSLAEPSLTHQDYLWIELTMYWF